MGEIELSSEGLHAAGHITYLQSVIFSPDILMFPDDAQGKCVAFNIDEGFNNRGHPEVIGRDHPFHWFPIKTI